MWYVVLKNSVTVLFYLTCYNVLSKNKEYNIIRKTWKGINQTKMEGGKERHLPKTDDRRRRVCR